MLSGGKVARSWLRVRSGSLSIAKRGLAYFGETDSIRDIIASTIICFVHQVRFAVSSLRNIENLRPYIYYYSAKSGPIIRRLLTNLYGRASVVEWSLPTPCPQIK